MSDEMESSATDLGSAQGGATAGERLVSYRDLMGAFSYWAVWQHPFHEPVGLFDIAKKLRAVFDAPEVEAGDFVIQWFPDSWTVERRIWAAIGEDPAFLEWNKPRNDHEYKNGFVATSRFDSIKPEFDFIDLHALTRNVAMMVFKQGDERTTAPASPPDQREYSGRNHKDI